MTAIRILYVFILLVAGILTGCVDTSSARDTSTAESSSTYSCQFLSAEGDTASPYTEPISTNYLIDQAMVEGKITDEERLVYFAYAIYEYSSLPVEFRGNFAWEPADEVTELTNTVMLAENMCELTPCIQEELRRVMGKGVTCNPH